MPLWLFFFLGIISALISTSQHLHAIDFRLAFVEEITFSAFWSAYTFLNSLQTNLASSGLSLKCSKSHLYLLSTAIPIPDNLRQLSIPIKINHHRNQHPSACHQNILRTSPLVLLSGAIGVESKDLENKAWWLESGEKRQYFLSLSLKAMGKAPLGLMEDEEVISS